MPRVAARISPSQSMSIAGRMNITQSILTTAPLAISMHMELMMSILEYTATPNVAAKSPIPLTIMDGMELESAVATAVFLSRPKTRSLL